MMGTAYQRAEQSAHRPLPLGYASLVVFVLVAAFSLCLGGFPQGIPLPAVAQDTAKPPAPEEKGTKWALLIGISQYDSTEIVPLKFAAKDAAAIAGSLEDLNFTKNHVITMTSGLARNSGQYPTLQNVMAQLNSLANTMGPDDTLMIFFSGHSYTREAKKGNAKVEKRFLATVNTNPLELKTLEETSLSLEKLRERVRAFKAGQVLYILDVCRNDPTPGQEDGDNPRTAVFSEEMKAVASETGSEGRKGMAPARVGVYFATAEKGRSWEDNDKQLGVFTTYLLESLTTGKGANEKRQMTMDTIAKYINESIDADWNIKNPRRKQAPELVSVVGAPIMLAPYRPKDVVFASTEKVDTLARLKLTTEPADATIRIGGDTVSNGEYSTNLVDAKEKEVDVSVTAPGYVGQIVKITLVQGKLVPFSVSLEKEAPAPDRGPANPKDNAELVQIPAGDFIMGSGDSESFKSGDETPQHTISLNGFWIYKNLVTVAQYEQFCLETTRSMPIAPEFNPNWAKKEDPICNVSYGDAVSYCEWAGGRLPTEAEWERAARGDKGQTYPWGNSFDDSKLWGSTKEKRSGPAAVYRTSYISESPFGVRDMSGNLWQWCSDWYNPSYYRSSPSRNPEGPRNGFARVLRGGSFAETTAPNYRAAKRKQGAILTPSPQYGFRVVLQRFSRLNQNP